MAESTTDQQRIEAAAAGLAAKYRAFSDGLTADEHAAFECVVRRIGGEAGAAGDDVAGYKDKCIDQMLALNAIVRFFTLDTYYVQGGTCDGRGPNANFGNPEIRPR
jgi:hypothetical protein